MKQIRRLKNIYIKCIICGNRLNKLKECKASLDHELRVYSNFPRQLIPAFYSINIYEKNIRYEFAFNEREWMLHYNNDINISKKELIPYSEAKKHITRILKLQGFL